MTHDLRISMIQSPILWDDIDGNLVAYEKKLRRLSGRTDIAVLPETFTTGFIISIQPGQDFKQDKVLAKLKRWAAEFDFAITGSFIARIGDHCYNRGFWVTPGGETCFYDKHHLFRMGGENNYFSPGNQHLVVEYKGWRIRPLICYDLRFPVWSRNVENEYDLLIYVANWPASRREVWKALLKARAIENLAFVCGVNRTGKDGKGYLYTGDSTLFSFKGETMATAGEEETETVTVLSHEQLTAFRNKFPAWMDADRFEILP